MASLSVLLNMMKIANELFFMMLMGLYASEANDFAVV